MSFQLPAAEKVEELMAPICQDSQSRDFVHWFAYRSGGKTLRNTSAVGAELAAALDDYVSASGIPQVAVNIWYKLYGDTWGQVLVG